MYATITDNLTIELPEDYIQTLRLNKGDKVRCLLEGDTIKMVPDVSPDEKVMFRCFGQFTIEYKETYLHLRIKKSREILALLLMERGRPLGKQRIAEMLWADSESPRALDCFYKAVRGIAEAAEFYGVPLPIRSNSGAVWLDMRRVDSDVISFDEFCKKGDIASYREAASLYTAPFLSKELYDWTSEWQAYYDVRYLSIIQRLIEYYQEKDPHLAHYYRKVQYRV